MSDKKDIFISHVHEDDAFLPKLKDFVARAGVEFRNGSINSNKSDERTVQGTLPGSRGTT